MSENGRSDDGNRVADLFPAALADWPPVDARLHEMVLADLREAVAKAVVSRPTDQSLGYLQGKIIAFALSGVITKSEYHDFHDELERVGLSSRMPGWDRYADT